VTVPIQSQGNVTRDNVRADVSAVANGRHQLAQAAATPGPAAPAPVPPGRDGSPNGGQVRR
jgi:hypothetical protein